MKKLTVLLVSLFLISCVTGGTTVANSYDSAAKYYVELSIAYDSAMDILVDLRAKHKITDAQWLTIDTAQHNVAAHSKKVRALLNVWKVTSQKPNEYDTIILSVIFEINKLQSMGTPPSTPLTFNNYLLTLTNAMRLIKC